MSFVRNFSERLARKTSRRGFFGRGAEVAFGALLGAAAGTANRPGSATAGLGTVCIFPGPPCSCPTCLANGTCAKPCVISTIVYPSGCWIERGVTCCDCECQDIPGTGYCGCGSDWHNEPGNCPKGNAG